MHWAATTLNNRLKAVEQEPFIRPEGWSWEHLLVVYG